MRKSFVSPGSPKSPGITGIGDKPTLVTAEAEGGYIPPVDPTPESHEISGSAQWKSGNAD
jgi:hypothetical protein